MLNHRFRNCLFVGATKLALRKVSLKDSVSSFDFVNSYGHNFLHGILFHGQFFNVKSELLCFVMECFRHLAFCYFPLLTRDAKKKKILWLLWNFKNPIFGFPWQVKLEEFCIGRGLSRFVQSGGFFRNLPLKWRTKPISGCQKFVGLVVSSKFGDLPPKTGSKGGTSGQFGCPRAHGNKKVRSVGGSKVSTFYIQKVSQNSPKTWPKIGNMR